MPALRFLPHARAYLRAVRRTNLYCRTIYAEKIHKPLLQALGLADDQALERAPRLSHHLPEHLEPDELTLSRAGGWDTLGNN